MTAAVRSESFSNHPNHSSSHHLGQVS